MRGCDLLNKRPAQFKIQDLISCLSPIGVFGERNGDLSGLAYDSRHVEPGAAFFALRGAGVDGHEFIDAAVEKGALAVVMDRKCAVPAGVTGLLVDDSRRALAAASALWFGNPTESMKVIGITGTNGKTTISFLLEAMLKESGMKPTVIGTVNYRYADRELPASHTTPESYELQQRLAEFRAAGSDSLVIEVSSHALEQKRVYGIRFDVGVFTNLTPEHLDYHGSMADYYLSKKRLFSEYVVPDGGVSVVNIDDAYGQRLADELTERVSCGVSEEASVRTTGLTMNRDGIEAAVTLVKGQFTLRSKLLGQFNVNNLLCAVAAAEAAGIPVDAISKGIAAVVNVPGRLERVENDKGALILVDYAHTGDALENVLSTLKGLQAKRIVTVFGCGGDRDKSKRPVMGEVAARYSDVAIVTSDNPRTENADAIIHDILPGVQQHFEQELRVEELAEPSQRGYLVERDRRTAIALAVRILRQGDLLLVAGKGHEDYQIIGTEKQHFDDREEILSALQKETGL